MLGKRFIISNGDNDEDNYQLTGDLKFNWHDTSPGAFLPKKIK